MAFDPFGCFARERFAAPLTVNSRLIKNVWVGPPNQIPVTWIPASQAEQHVIQMLQALNQLSLNNKYLFFSNVPLAQIFGINARAFVSEYGKNPHWTGGRGSSMARVNRRGAFRALRKQIGVKSVDILMCDNAGHIVAAIEVDGPHHRKPEQQFWDFSKNMLFTAFDFPVYRLSLVDVNSGYIDFCQAQITTTFQKTLNRSYSFWRTFKREPSVRTMQLHCP